MSRYAYTISERRTRSVVRRNRSHGSMKSSSKETNDSHVSTPQRQRQSMLYRLDQLDKWLSDPIFSYRLPVVAEYLLSLPGNMFGLPVFAFSVIPSWTVMMVSNYHKEFRLPTHHNQHPTTPVSTALWVGLLVVLTVYVLRCWIALLKGNKSMVPTFYSTKSGTLSPLLGVAMLSRSPWPKACQVGYFQVACWCVGVLPVAVLKPIVGRRRPCADMRSSKHLRVLVRIFQHDATQSFPSGDVAGAVSLLYPIWRLWHQDDALAVPIVCVVCVLLSGLGRMYWQAHHLGDVLTGMVIPIPFLFALEKALEDYCRALWWQALLAYASLCLLVMCTRGIMRKGIFVGGTIPQKAGSA